MEKLKNLSKEELSTFLTSFLKNFNGFNGLVKNSDGLHTVTFLTAEPSVLLNEINSKVHLSLNVFIESDLEENCKSYNRNIILYESEETPNSLILRWV